MAQSGDDIFHCFTYNMVLVQGIRERVARIYKGEIEIEIERGKKAKGGGCTAKAGWGMTCILIMKNQNKIRVTSMLIIQVPKGLKENKKVCKTKEKRGE